MSNRSSLILECVKKGLPIDHIPVIDFHTHTGGSSRFYYVPYSSSDNFVAYMDGYGVDHAVTFALSTTTDAAVKNNAVYDAVQTHPGRFSSLTTLHARFPQDWMGLLEEGHRRGTRGIKLLADYQGVDELSIDWSSVFGYAQDKNWVVLHHDWRTPEHLAEYAGDFPAVTFIIGHPTLEVENSRILEKHDNIYQCTCAEFVTPGFSRMTIEEMYNKLPLEKILFGSDALDLDLGTAIGPLAYAKIPEEAKEKILGKNALELMNKLGWQTVSYE
jgi:predicted TIM-barrel fold metal-dependent hydrolase